MRGFVSGVIWGGVVSVLGLGVVSQLAPMPGANISTAPTVEVANATPAAQPSPAELSPDSVAKAAEEPALTPAAEPAPVKLAPTEPAKEPEVVVPAKPVVEVAPAAAPAAAPAVAPKASEPVVAPPEPAVVKPAPDAPAPTASSSAPAALTAPDGATPAPALPAAADAAPKPGQVARPAAPAADQQPAAAELPPVPPLTAEEQAVLDQPLAPAVDAEPVVPAVPTPDAASPADPAPPVAEAQPSDTPKLPEVVATAPSSISEPTAPLRPTPGLTNSADGVTVGRLPSIASTPKPADDASVADGTEDNASADVVVTEDLPAVDRFAARFENPENKPVFAVVLIDTGGPNVDRKMLAALPFPVTFAIDPTAPDAATAAAIYREAGQEVMMLATGIPAGAVAADLEVTFQAHQAALPEAVAVLDIEEGGFQNDRPLATQVVPVIKGQGRGLVTWDKGLNAGDQVARRDGVPAAMVFRRLDGANENASTMRRYLDRAAFKAAQDGRVAVVGQTTPETVAALMEWAVEGRASTVALAPITAVLIKP